MKRTPGEKKAGSLYIPETAKRPQAEGEVIAVGEGVPWANGTIYRPPLEIGDLVVFNPEAGRKVTIDGEEVIILAQEHIDVVVSKE